MGNHRLKHQRQEQIARAVKLRLTILIGVLIAILLTLLLGIGEGSWPMWVLVHRSQIAGVLVLAVVVLILASPIIMEATINTRTLSGPGKNPKGPRLE
ncbi:MAG TPA: hypothetical protein VIR02_19760 [Anaerolineales bacterium]